MVRSALDPVWTEKPREMRILDPLGAESTEGDLQDRLLRPVLSIAITQRLRYLSYWAWVTSNLEQHSPTDRAQYEKVFLLGSLAHDCPPEGTGSNGIMRAADAVEAALDDPSITEILIDPASLSIAGADRARFDQYYKGVFYRLHLLENEWTVTPLGTELASAFDSAVDVEFEDVQTAVETDAVPKALIQRFTEGGCLCQLSTCEPEILARSYFYLVTRTGHYDELAYDLDPDPELLALSPFLGEETAEERGTTALIEATLAGTGTVEGADYSEDLEGYTGTVLRGRERTCGQLCKSRGSDDSRQSTYI